MSRVCSYVEVPDKRDAAAVRSALTSTIAQAQSTTFDLQDRDALVKAIITDLASKDVLEPSPEEPIWKTWDGQTYETALECIKVLSRSPAGTSYLSTPAGIHTLRQHAQHGTGNSTPKARQHAVSALCNVLLLHPTAPSLCVKEALGDWALRELASDASTGTEQMWSFLMARVIMVLTSRATYGFLERLVDDLNGLSIIKARLEDVLRYPDHSHLALVDYMKIMYHIFALYPETQGEQWDQRFDEYAPLILDLLLASPIMELAPPVTNIINVLTRFSPDVLRNTAESRVMKAAMKILDVTTAYVGSVMPPPPWKPGDDVSLPGYDAQLLGNLDQVLPPPLLVLVNLMHAEPRVKREIKERVIPADLDRSTAAGPLEERSDVLGYMLRLSRSAINHVTAAAVGEVLWVVCGENATTLSTEIGYGNAAGILFHKGMGLPPKPEATVEEIPDDPSPADDDTDDAALRNPITGLEQAEDEPKSTMADMTDEEKEREAERMMALFDRMERNPAMQLVENPMKEAVRSGKIEEWEKSEDEKELQRIREQEAADEAEAAKEVSEWKKRMGRS